MTVWCTEAGDDCLIPELMLYFSLHFYIQM